MAYYFINDVYIRLSVDELYFHYYVFSVEIFWNSADGSFFPNFILWYKQIFTLVQHGDHSIVNFNGL